MLWFLYSNQATGNNAGSWNMVIADDGGSSDVDDAIAAANAARPSGEAKVKGGGLWSGVSLGASAALPDGATVAWLQGRPSAFLGLDSGGSPVAVV